MRLFRGYPSIKPEGGRQCPHGAYNQDPKAVFKKEKRKEKKTSQVVVCDTEPSYSRGDKGQGRAAASGELASLSGERGGNRKKQGRLPPDKERARRPGWAVVGVCERSGRQR